jgi:hypothetical protein
MHSTAPSGLFRALSNSDKPFVAADLLPALDRMGKNAQLLLRPDQVMFVQMGDETDGCLVKLELPSVRYPTRFELDWLLHSMYSIIVVAYVY